MAKATTPKPKATDKSEAAAAPKRSRKPAAAAAVEAEAAAAPKPKPAPKAKPAAAPKPAAAKAPVRKPAAAKAVVAEPAAVEAAPAKAPRKAAAKPSAAKAKPAAVAESAAPEVVAAKPATTKAAKPAAKPAAKSAAKPAAKASKPDAKAKAPARSPKSVTKPGPDVAQKPAAAPIEVKSSVIDLTPTDTVPRVGATPAREAPSIATQEAPSSTEKTAPSASSAKPWLASYPPNVPAEIPGLPANSIGELIVTSCEKFAARKAFSCMGKDLTYAELEEGSTSFGAYLQSLGLPKGARVALMMPNVLQYPVALVGVLRAGYVVVNVNPLYTARELEHQLNDSGAEAIVILENFAATLQSVINKTAVKHVVVAALGDMLGLKGAVVNLVVRRVKKMVPAWSLKGHVRFNTAMKLGKGKTLRKPVLMPDDVAFLQYTGGTTGISKGAMLTHGNVLSNVAQSAAWFESGFIKKKRPDEPVFICPLPLYHIYALTVNAMVGIFLGAQNVLITNPRDIPAFVKELGKYRFHFFPGLNTLFNALLNNKDFQKLDFSSLMLTFGGGMAVQQSVAERWQKLTGCLVAEGYGLSETSPVAVANRFDGEHFTATIGLPIPSTEVAIRGEDNGEMPLGEVGEICIRGPQVMKGYWNRPDETAKVMTADGFLKTGDMGFMDSRGYTKIVDRKKDMILVSGFNVYPNELEDVVSRHPKVLEVAAVGVPDEKSGEVPKLFVVKKDPTLTEEELRAFCRENLTAYKRPRLIEFRQDLPKTNVGKILRRELRG